jgi:hypothetical protein
MSGDVSAPVEIDPRQEWAGARCAPSVVASATPRSFMGGGVCGE